MPASPHYLAREALKFNVLFLRAQKRLSQAKLADRAGISRTIISAVENGDGNVTLDVLANLAGALKTTVAYLLTDHVKAGGSDEDIARRAEDGPEAYVDRDDFLVALEEQTGRYSKRGRRKTVSTSVSSRRGGFHKKERK